MHAVHESAHSNAVANIFPGDYSDAPGRGQARYDTNRQATNFYERAVLSALGRTSRHQKFSAAIYSNTCGYSS